MFAKLISEVSGLLGRPAALLARPSDKDDHFIGSQLHGLWCLLGIWGGQSFKSRMVVN